MKRMSIVITVILSLMIMVGCATSAFAATQSVANNHAAQTVTVQQNVKHGEITEAQAKKIVLKHAGLKSKEVKFIKCYQDLDDGILKYEIEFIHGEQKFEYDVRVNDGMILDFSIDSVYDD